MVDFSESDKIIKISGDKGINQRLSTGFVVIYCSSFDKERYITTKPVVSVWFIHVATYYQIDIKLSVERLGQ